MSTVPETLPPNTMPPLVPVDRRAKVPVAVIVPEVVNAVALAAESVRLTLPPVEVPVPVKACELTRVTLPVVLNVMLGVTILERLIEPVLPLLPRANEVVPVTVPEPVMVLEPVAFTATVVPETEPAIATLPPTVTDRGPLLVIVPVLPTLKAGPN